MNIKSLLLGSAAVLVAATGARAADAIVIAEPEPVEYVRVCDTYGAGYFYIPGTETCMRIQTMFMLVRRVAISVNIMISQVMLVQLLRFRRISLLPIVLLVVFLVLVISMQAMALIMIPMAG